MTHKELTTYYEKYDARLARLYTGATPDAPCRLAGITAGIAFPEPYHYACDEETIAHFAAGVAQARGNLAREAEQLSDDGIFRPLIIEHHLYGVHFMGTLWNVPAFFRDGQWWNKALPTPVGTLWEPELERHPTVTLMETLGRLLVEGTENHTFISMQVFAAPLNLVVDLYGERLLEALALDPEVAEHDIEVATRTIIAMHRRWMQLIPAARLRNFAAAGRYMPAGYYVAPRIMWRHRPSRSQPRRFVPHNIQPHSTAPHPLFTSTPPFTLVCRRKSSLSRPGTGLSSAFE